jgi:hypothetical protein
MANPTASPANKLTTTRTVHPQHPAATFAAADSGSIVINKTPGKAAVKMTTGTQTGGTKEGEVFTDFV